MRVHLTSLAIGMAALAMPTGCFANNAKGVLADAYSAAVKGDRRAFSASLLMSSDAAKRFGGEHGFGVFRKELQAHGKLRILSDTDLGWTEPGRDASGRYRQDRGYYWQHRLEIGNEQGTQFVAWVACDTTHSCGGYNPQGDPRCNPDFQFGIHIDQCRIYGLLPKATADRLQETTLWSPERYLHGYDPEAYPLWLNRSDTWNAEEFLTGRNCGTQGSIEDRIKSCDRTQVTSQRVHWTLVSHVEWDGDQNGHEPYSREIWRDDATGILWGDRIYSPGMYATFQNGAKRLCGEEMGISYRGALPGEKRTEAATNPEDYLLNSRDGTIPDRQWSLPSVDDYRVAEAHGLRQVQRKMKDHVFWTSSTYEGQYDYGWIYDGNTGTFEVDHYGHSYSIRCISR